MGSWGFNAISSPIWDHNTVKASAGSINWWNLPTISLLDLVHWDPRMQMHTATCAQFMLSRFISYSWNCAQVVEYIWMGWTKFKGHQALPRVWFFQKKIDIFPIGIWSHFPILILIIGSDESLTSSTSLFLVNSLSTHIYMSSKYECNRAFWTSI